MLSLALLPALVHSLGCGTTKTIDSTEEEPINANPCNGEYPDTSPPTEYYKSQSRQADAKKSRERTKTCECHTILLITWDQCSHAWSEWAVEQTTKLCYRPTKNCDCANGQPGADGSCPEDNGTSCISCDDTHQLLNNACVPKVPVDGDCSGGLECVNGTTCVDGICKEPTTTTTTTTTTPATEAPSSTAEPQAAGSLIQTRTKRLHHFDLESTTRPCP